MKIDPRDLGSALAYERAERLDLAERIAQRIYEAKYIEKLAELRAEIDRLEDQVRDQGRRINDAIHVLNPEGY